MTKRAAPTSTEQVKGSVKEAIGKLTGDVRIEAEGRRQTGADELPGGEDTPPRGPASRKA